MSSFALFDNCQLCISLGESTLTDLLHQMEKAAQWADLIEIRLDKLKHLEIEPLKILKQHVSCPLIWTLRKASQGGSFEGTEEERLAILRSLLINLEPAFVDLEADTPKPLIKALQALSPCTRWIISWHDQTETPANLEVFYQQVTQHQADYYKIVTFAQTTLDALRMLHFSLKHNQQGRQLCGLCLGEFGQSTRILGPLVGHPFTFVSLETGKETAAGQLTAEELVKTYRFREVNRETQLLGLIGRPVDKSLSHLTHNAVLRHLSFNALYLKFHLQDKELSAFFEEIKSLPIRGLSVTMPFKEQVLALLEYPHALAACNTLVWTSQGLHGYNTDGIGALNALGFSSLEGQKIVILGAGGTAKAIALAAHQQGAQLAILNRTLERAKYLAEPLHATWGPLDQLPALTQMGYMCVIQATSVGMAPAIEETLIPTEWIPKEALVLDVVSNPPETRLLKESKRKGGKTISGHELFIHQAVEQFVCWFGKDIPKDQIEQTIRQQIPKINTLKSVQVHKSVLKGMVRLPPSKSHTVRAILLASIAKGTSFLHNLLDSPDGDCAIQAACQFGAKVTSTQTGLAITGVAGYPHIPHNVIDAGNSGQVLRFAAALATLSKGYTVITGDESIRSNRPIQPLIEGLKGLKGWAVSTRENGYAPLVVKGPLQAGFTSLEGQDSQPVSALLMAASFTNGQTEIQVSQAGEKPWIALTLSWLDRLGVSYSHRNFEHFIIQGKRVRPAFEMTIPGDLSTVAFPLVAALVTKSELTIHHVDIQDVQGDKELIFLLQRMGAHLEIDVSRHLLKVFIQSKLKGQVVDVNNFIDAVPILAVLGCYAEGETQLVNAAIARRKESNRLACITAELRKMGASIEETVDGLRVQQSELKGACVNSHGDHRLAMSLIIAGLGAKGETEVQGIECISKSYPTFLADLRRLGAHINEEDR
jgi:3-phosphoshikimate 1-carboxyvinyltransferase